MPRLRLRPRGLIPGISFGREPSNSTGGTLTRVASGFPGARRVGRHERDERRMATDRLCLPLIEPDVRISRIRLSEAVHRVAS